MTATGGADKKTALVMGFDGKGQMSLLLTIGDGEDPKSAVWTGKAPVGAAAGRTEDAVTFTDLAVQQMPGGFSAKASGSLKCESQDGLL
ncbi:hypothetical protein [Streptomyces rubellomurinus]|nr:hypothetical protein [Streptomyces rubellomurinus]